MHSMLWKHWVLQKNKRSITHSMQLAMRMPLILCKLKPCQAANIIFVILAGSAPDAAKTGTCMGTCGTQLAKVLPLVAAENT